MTELNANAITMIFWPRFGAPEADPETEKTIHLIDKNLAGHIKVHRPSARGGLFTIGRAPSCTYRLGYNPAEKDYARNSLGQAQFRHFSNIHCTLELIRGTWFIYPGGEYPVEQGGEWGNPSNGLYVNGSLLPEGKDPFPLFYREDRFSKVQLGDLGKILFMRGVFGEQSTHIPSDWWIGEGWPDLQAIKKARARYLAAQKKIPAEETAEAHEAGISPAAANTPWFVPAILDPGWLWFKSQPRLLQVLILVLASCLIALWIVER